MSTQWQQSVRPNVGPLSMGPINFTEPMFIMLARWWPKEQVVLSFEHCTSSHTSQKPSLTDTSGFPQSHPQVLVQPTNSSYAQKTQSVLGKGAENLVGRVKPQERLHGTGNIAPRSEPSPVWASPHRFLFLFSFLFFTSPEASALELASLLHSLGLFFLSIPCWNHFSP